MLKSVGALASAIVLASTVSVSAQETCGGNYKIQPGDSLSLIADRFYKNVSQWTAIYRNNTEKVPNPDNIIVGRVLRLPCIGGLPTGLEGGDVVGNAVAPTAQLNAAPQEPVAVAEVQEQRQQAARQRDAQIDVRLLAGDDFRPFTNRLQMNSGMITDLVNRAYVADDSTGKHKFYWVNDRAVHLDPMLSDGMADLAFPWKKPRCEGEAAESTFCTDFLYSEPMFEMLVVLFADKSRPITFNSDADLANLRICSPLGYNTGSRYGAGANYLKGVGARLQQPVTAEECFDRLVIGSTDAVAMNEFTGRVTLKDMGLDEQVELMLRRPLAIEGLHVVAHKSNPRAQELIEAFNNGLEALRDSGEYLRVIDTHMSSIWSGL